MHPSDTSIQAMRWLIELQTADRLDDVWDDFDAWFQASPAHRAAYVKARRHWLKLAGLTPPTMIRNPNENELRHLPNLASITTAHWELILAALLAVMITFTNV
jgi:ferric-dicitrate binding protein FerR (iron transport regulator)